MALKAGMATWFHLVCGHLVTNLSSTLTSRKKAFDGSHIRFFSFEVIFDSTRFLGRSLVTNFLVLRGSERDQDLARGGAGAMMDAADFIGVPALPHVLTCR